MATWPSSIFAILTTSVLDRGGDWELRVDLDRKLVFPEIMDSTLRPDMVLWSRQAKTIIVIELTVPWEEWELQRVAPEKEPEAYIPNARLQIILLPVEVGCRGFPAQSVSLSLTHSYGKPLTTREDW